VFLLVRVTMMDKNKAVGSLSELLSSLCERQMERTVLRPACPKCAVYSAFPSGMTSHSKIARFN